MKSAPENRFLLLLFLGALLPVGLQAQEDTSSPEPLQTEDFSALQSNSPFTRSLNLSNTLILTGIARIGDQTIATIMDREKKETYVVGQNAPNAQGWRMVEIDGNQGQLDQVTARIAVTGGEIVSIRFDEEQLKPGEARPGAGSGSGQRPGGGDGRRGGPPEEVRQKLEKLSEEQRTKLFDYMRKVREENPGLTRDEMRARFGSALERASGAGGGGGGGGGDRRGR